MKKLSSFLFLCLFPWLNLPAQQEYYKFLLDQFEKGKIIYTNGGSREAVLNYETVSEKMLFMLPDSTIWELAQPKLIESVYIGDRVFEHIKKGIFYERMNTGNELMYMRWRSHVVSRGKEAGYGLISATGAIDNIDRTFGGGTLNQLKSTEKFETAPRNMYYLKIKNKLKQVSSFKAWAKSYQPAFPLGEFIRPAGINPVLSPDPSAAFFCPMNQTEVHWEESDAFNPGAVVKDGKIAVLYRAEDNSATGIGARVSRIALAETTDGFTMTKHPAPVIFPADDNNKLYEWPGGCEDPRVAVTEEDVFVIFYTAWDRKVARLCVATSTDLVHWEKHGPVFKDAYGGRFLDTWSKASSILTTIKDDKLVIAKINGKYFMYWGEYVIYGATSDDLKSWTPVLDGNDELKILMAPRPGYFDSDLTECGPPAILTEEGIILLYNGKNKKEEGDPGYVTDAYCAGQALFDIHDPTKLIKRLDKPFLIPLEDFEKSGQYPAGTVFIEGLVYYQNRWFLYYGCADSHVALAVYDPLRITIIKY